MEFRAEDRMLRSPDNLADLGVEENVVADLFLKQAYMAGNCSIRSLAASLRLPLHLTEALFRSLKSNQMIEVRGTIGDDFSFVLSQPGKVKAMERLQISRYSGPVPVPLAQYEGTVRAQVARTRLNRDRLAKAYQDLSVPADLLLRLGPALVAQKSMLLYGPSGTGKSSLAERILRIYDDRIAVPFSVEVDGNIIAVFDPAVHQPVGEQRADDDPRWVFCKRPSIIVGGELDYSMLELQREADSGRFIAPLHMKANNGIFVIDDFGRQMISPRDLLNRWIVPLDRRIDYLTINGAKVAIPFEVFVVFSTNLDPKDLADDAFLRRLPNKILVDAISPELFGEIVQKRLEATGWAAETGAAEYLSEVCRMRGGDLRGCYPRDILQIISSIAEFEEQQPKLTRTAVDQATELYYGQLQRA
jgi:hypothetical protein